jgi:hypothetical protein
MCEGIDEKLADLVLLFTHSKEEGQEQKGDKEEEEQEEEEAEEQEWRGGGGGGRFVGDRWGGVIFIGDSREPWDEEKSNNTTLFQFKMLVGERGLGAAEGSRFV